MRDLYNKIHVYNYDKMLVIHIAFYYESNWKLLIYSRTKI